MSFFDLVNLDAKTLIGALFWGNFASVIICGAYSIMNLRGEFPSFLKYVNLGKLLQSIGWFMLFFRGFMPDLLSSGLGNSCLIVGIGYESQALLCIIKQETKFKMNLLKVFMIAGVLLYNIIDWIFKSGNLRVVFASICVFIILFVPISYLLFSKASKPFYRFLGALYLFFNLMLLPRIIMNLFNPQAMLFTNNTIQSLTFISLILIMVCSLTVFYTVFLEDRVLAENRMATYDYLTNLLNRQVFFKRCKSALAVHLAEQQSLSFAIMSINNFKKLNSDFGDNFADKVLKSIADTLRQNIRHGDLICRYSGKHFAIVLMNCNESMAKIILKRLCNTISQINFEGADGLRVTTSVGISSGMPHNGTAVMDYVDGADRCLFEAKTNTTDKIISTLIYDVHQLNTIK